MRNGDRFGKHWLIMATVVVCISGRPVSAQAGYFSLGVGSGIEMVHSTTQLKLTQELGFHFGRWRSGPGLGLALGESFGDELVHFQVGPKLLWDIPITGRRGVVLLLGPSLQLGYGMRARSGGDPNHAFNIKVGASFKLLFGRVLFFFDPFGLDMYLGDPFAMRYDLVGGLGLTF